MYRSVLRLLLVTLVVGLGMSSMAFAQPVEDLVKRSFDVDEGGVLSIDTDFGDVEIEAVRGSSVFIEVKRSVEARGSEADKLIEGHQLDIEQRGDNIYIRARQGESSNWKRWRDDRRIKMTIRVRIPEEYDVDFTTGAGNVWMADVVGDVEGKTGAGNIDIASLRGDVDVLSGAGNITIDEVNGDVDVKTGAGNVTIREVIGQLDAGTGAGNLVAEAAESLAYDCDLTSGAGNVTLYVDEDMDFHVDAVAGMGSASTDFDLKVEGKWMSKSFKGTINSGGPSVKLRSGVGNVSLLKI